MEIEIKYYLDEDSFNNNVDYFRETIYGTIDYANQVAKNRMRHTIFNYFNVEVRAKNRR